MGSFTLTPGSTLKGRPPAIPPAPPSVVTRRPRVTEPRRQASRTGPKPSATHRRYQASRRSSTAANSRSRSKGCPAWCASEGARPWRAPANRVWLTLMPMPRMTTATPSAPMEDSARIPPTFSPRMSRSLGHSTATGRREVSPPPPPAPPGAPPPPRLVLGPDHRALRRPPVGQAPGLDLGRVHLAQPHGGPGGPPGGAAPPPPPHTPTRHTPP